MIAVAFAYHNFAYVLNDVVDLPVDITQPARANYPLVRGTVTPGTALLFALIQVPLAFILTGWLRGHGDAFAWLAAAFLLMAVYNVWGKRIAVPPVTDTVQGLAWGSLLFYGATVAPGQPTMLTWLTFSFIVVYITLINGVNASLRDLVNDLRCNARTTAIWMGVRPLASSALAIPAWFRRYAFILQIALFALALWLLARNDFDYGITTMTATFAAFLGLSVLCLFLLAAITRPVIDLERTSPLYMTHIILALAMLLTLFIPYLEGPLRLTLPIVFTVPLLTSDWLQEMIGKRGQQSGSNWRRPLQ